MVISKKTSIGQTMEIPARVNPSATLLWIFATMPKLGFNPAEAARGYSSDEWIVDYMRIDELATSCSMSDDDFEILVRRIQERNRLVWGEYSIFWNAPVNERGVSSCTPYLAE